MRVIEYHNPEISKLHIVFIRSIEENNLVSNVMSNTGQVGDDNY